MQRLRSLRRHFTPATVIALVALFAALGGSSYAVLKINGSQIENRSIAGKKLKRNTLGGVSIKESRLGKVRRARRADRLGRFRSRDLRLHCPRATTFVSGICAEVGTRPAAPFGVARIECDAARRRLPTYEELSTLVSGADIAVAPPGELTSSVFVEGGLKVVTVRSDAGGAEAIPNTAAFARPFRCVAYPSN